MFWGITLESGKKYSQKLQRSFCVTMAALGFENPSNDLVYVIAEVNEAQHVLCSLQAGKVPQQVLNLSFTEGEHVTFSIEGVGQVHLTGYLTLDEDDSDSDDSDEDSDEDVCEQNAQLLRDYSLQKGSDGEVAGAVGGAVGGGNTAGQVSDISWQRMLSASQENHHVSGNGVSNNEQGNDNTVVVAPITNDVHESSDSEEGEGDVPSESLTEDPNVDKDGVIVEDEKDNSDDDDDDDDDSGSPDETGTEKPTVSKRKRNTESNSSNETVKKSRGAAANADKTSKQKTGPTKTYASRKANAVKSDPAKKGTAKSKK